MQLELHLRQRAMPYALALAGLVFLSFLASIFLYADGGFYYTLDDPYIHLSLAENIAHGHFGINPGEVASPASSLIWPFLLSIWAFTPWLTYAPLIYNALALGCCVLILAGVVKDEKAFPAWFVILLPTVFLLGFNGFELAYTGMEHVLLLMALLGSAVALHSTLTQGRSSWLGLACIALAPLVRPEILPVSMACFAILLLTPERWKSVTLTVLMLGLIVGYGVFLVHLGLPPVPSSIMEKFTGHAATGLDHTFTDKLMAIGEGFLSKPVSRLQSIALTLFALLATSQYWAANWRRYLILLPAAAAVAVVFIMPEPSYNGRYANPSLAFLGMLCLLNWKDVVSPLLLKLSPLKKSILLILFAWLCLGTLPSESWRKSPVHVPWAARSLYKQHTQLHDFITRYYQGTVGAHDIGRMSYENDYQLVDLAGLASERVRTLKREHPDTWIQDIVNEKHIGLLIFYESWINPAIFPSTWHKIAVYKNTEQIWAIGDATVDIYATPYADEDHTRAALEAFKKTLPAGVELSIF
jgi:hypothetical protein